jgi:pyridinium-3,5-biscarboxylic acid mononucleotide sulfurtransferase
MLTLDDRIAGLRRLLAELDRVVVCFSGGVDSGYLLAEAVDCLGDRAVALTAVSPSLAPEERADAQVLAHRLGARHVLVDTDELDDARYTSNPVNRCYFCKTEVYGRAVNEARRLGVSQVLDGFNIDDRGDHRPGRQAAREQGVRSPLDELGFTKANVREAAQRLGLPVWDKPSLACLSSRFPYGVTITPDRLTRVATCERALRDLGFRVCRVRFHDTKARIEVETQEIARLRTPAIRRQILGRFLDAGFDTVTVDPRGYRSGALNEGLLTIGGTHRAPQIDELAL